MLLNVEIHIYELVDTLSMITEHMHVGMGAHISPIQPPLRAWFKAGFHVLWRKMLSPRQAGHPGWKPRLPTSDRYSKWSVNEHLLRLATIKHARVDEVRAHDSGLHAIFSSCQEFQTNRLCKTHCGKLAGTVVCKEIEQSDAHWAWLLTLNGYFSS